MNSRRFLKFLAVISASLIFLSLVGISSQASAGGEPNSVLPTWEHLGLTWRASVASDSTEGNSYRSECTLPTVSCNHA